MASPSRSRASHPRARACRIRARSPIRRVSSATAKSAAISSAPASCCTARRRSPTAAPNRSALAPVMTLRSKLIGVQALEPGASVGYGGTFAAAQPMRIGVIACGYADGYPRHAPNGTPVLVDGHRVPMAGRVSMDMITVDLSSVPRRAGRQRRRAVGRRIAGGRRRRAPPAPSVMNCCAPSRLAYRSRCAPMPEDRPCTSS